MTRHAACVGMANSARRGMVRGRGTGTGMRICIFTNTFLPHVGGVARSVRTFVQDYRRARHDVLVLAPEFANGPAPRAIERLVERVPAWQNFNGSDFSVSLPLGPRAMQRIQAFEPDIIHAQHPFFLGSSAVRIAAQRGVPVVFTHHTRYEQYTHYLPFDSAPVQAFVIELATRFANCCQGVIAPSASLAQLLARRGVSVPVKVIPTGIDTRAFAAGQRARWRRRLGVADDAVLIGHVGRLAEEKNLRFLAQAVGRCLAEVANTQALIVGDGPARQGMAATLAEWGLADRVHFAGQLTGPTLRDAYAAMDLFVFSSQSETQGMVLAEAMAAGCPVIALDASGVRDVVQDGENGRMLPADANVEMMARVLAEAVRDPAARERWQEGARRTAVAFDRRNTARQALEFYGEVRAAFAGRTRRDADEWEDAWRQWRDRLAIEGRLLGDKVVAVTHALFAASAPPDSLPVAG